MPRVPARSPTGERIVMFVPRWLQPTEAAGLPYRVVPIVSALTNAGVDVDLYIEPHDGVFGDDCRRDLDGALAAVAWCAELNPAEQMPGVYVFLSAVAAAAPELPRLFGGGFVPLTPREFHFEGLAEAVRGEEVGALLQQLRKGQGTAAGERQPFAVDALFAMDLSRFVRPASLLFGNDAPCLQIPTGLGCGKRCPFCFYERTHMRLLPAAAIADVVEHCVQRYGVHQYQLGELDFLAGPARALDFAAAVRKRSLPARWFALASVQDILRLGRDGMRELAAGGLSVMETGTEAGSDDALARLGKRFTAADALAAHELMVEAGVRPVHNFLLGWPGETPAHRRATLAVVARMHRRAPNVVMHFRHYQAIPSTTYGDRVVHHFGPLPASLGELERWRAAQARLLPWLPARDEAEVRFLAEYVLPLGYGDTLAPGRSPFVRRVLRRVARLRCRTGFLRLPLDRRLFTALCRRGLRTTWLA